MVVEDVAYASNDGEQQATDEDGLASSEPNVERQE